MSDDFDDEELEGLEGLSAQPPKKAILGPSGKGFDCRFATRPPHLRAAAVGEWGASAHVYMVASDPI